MMLLSKTSASANINQAGDNGQPCLLLPNKETVTVREIVTKQQDSKNEQIILLSVPQLCFIFVACLLLFSILHHLGLLTGSYRTYGTPKCRLSLFAPQPYEEKVPLETPRWQH